MLDQINDSNYRAFPAVSNSDLTWLQKYWMPTNQYVDLRKAYANGTLIDAMITEPHKVNFFTYRVEGEDYQYSLEEFEAAKEMKKTFMKDPFCQSFIKGCKFQHISYNPAFKINCDGFGFTLPAKCKWDLFRPDIDLGGDIKSTACTTQKQVEEALRYFEYPRSRAWYMDLENRNNDILIFISKVNFKIFKVPIKRGDALYNEGKSKYQELAFKWWYLFGDLPNMDIPGIEEAPAGAMGLQHTTNGPHTGGQNEGIKIFS